MAAGVYKLSLCLTAPLSLLHPHRRPLSLLRLLRHRHSRISLPPPLSAALHPHLRSIQNSFTQSFPPAKSSQQFHSQTTNSLRDNEPIIPTSHPWPEWSQFIDSLFAGGRYKFDSEEGQSFGLVYEGLSDDFLRAASACLCFARDRHDILGLISRREIEVLVENGTPFLFKNASDTERRMRSFIANRGSHVFGPDETEAVDLMKYILSYASNQTISPERNNSYSSQATESSVRYLLREMADLSSRVPTSARELFQISGRSEEPSKSFGPNIQMKRGDWICPKCKFMNFARNTKCIECEELRPKRQLTGGEWDCPQCGFFNYGRNLACLKCDCRRPGEGSAVESRFSQLNLTSDLNNAAAVDGFPRSERGSSFVVKPRKTPLERQLVNSQYQNRLLNNVTPESNDSQYRGTKTSISNGLDHILGSTSANSGVDIGSRPPIANSGSPQYGNSKRGDPNYVPFVPLPADMFAKKPQNSTNEVKEDLKSFGKPTVEEGNGQIKEKDQEEKAERWFKKVAELHDVKDLTSAISDEDFPEIMPMRKGENRFVVSKKKDRSLTSPTYKRQAAMEQGSNTNFVPFVPFPPDYFVKKDKQQTELRFNNKSADGTFSSHVNLVQGTQNQQISSPDKLNSASSIESRGQNSETASSRYSRPQNSSSNNSNTNSGVQVTSYTPNFVESTPTTSGNQSVKSRWTGKSLEGSAVMEPDPLDMSEEAKAERWFRRVAQIKDISELSQIPDEDFPSIMPMRKGVNRFVVSKRKTPLERRLMSPQYRKNLPVVSSDPIKKESDSS